MGGTQCTANGGTIQQPRASSELKPEAVCSFIFRRCLSNPQLPLASSTFMLFCELHPRILILPAPPPENGVKSSILPTRPPHNVQPSPENGANRGLFWISSGDDLSCLLFPMYTTQLLWAFSLFLFFYAIVVISS